MGENYSEITNYTRHENRFISPIIRAFFTLLGFQEEERKGRPFLGSMPTYSAHCVPTEDDPVHDTLGLFHPDFPHGLLLVFRVILRIASTIFLIFSLWFA